MENQREANTSDVTLGDASPLSVAIQMPISRRDFLRVAGIGSLGIALPYFLPAEVVAASPAEQGYGPNSKGMVIGDPSRCTGCRRCEIACTSFNDGRNEPTLARVKVGRNLNFGPGGAQLGYRRGEGHFGNFLLVQDTCRQCPHPVPCMSACPNGAIEIVAPTNARVINVDKCTGCRLCQAACPWAMLAFDEQAKKSTKCHLCNGDPECVKACPNSALRYVPWQDRTKDIPPRWTIPGYVASPQSVSSTCGSCHK
ncbi:MAG: 4Fe-4S dicluster domain-containing protein [Chloroflexi bacterium]|nr:4Fe-4S dicluster domain-containing protein [Chloroflexota bacterium]